MSAWLTMENLGLTEGGTRIIADVSLQLAAQRTLVLGPNGAGKSTLLRLIHNLLHPTAGALHWPRALTQAMVFQRPVMLRRSALANVIYGLKVKGYMPGECEVRARQALARVGAVEPELLILDEPTASLDPASSREVERIINDIAGNGTRILMTTHNLGLARRLAQEIVFIDNGRIVEQTPVELFFTRPQTDAAQRFLQEEIP